MIYIFVVGMVMIFVYQAIFRASFIGLFKGGGGFVYNITFSQYYYRPIVIITSTMVGERKRNVGNIRGLLCAISCFLSHKRVVICNVTSTGGREGSKTALRGVAS